MSYVAPGGELPREPYGRKALGEFWGVLGKFQEHGGGGTLICVLEGYHSYY